MKRTIPILLLFLAVSCTLWKPLTLLPANDPSLPPLKPGKPLFQGGKQVRNEADMKLYHQQRLSEIGLDLILWGSLACCVGIATCLAFQAALIDTIGSAIGFFGFCSMGIGLGLMFISDWYIWLSYGAILIAIIGLVVYFRGKGLQLKKPVLDKGKRTNGQGK